MLSPACEEVLGISSSSLSGSQFWPQMGKEEGAEIAGICIMYIRELLLAPEQGAHGQVQACPDPAH